MGVADPEVFGLVFALHFSPQIFWSLKKWSYQRAEGEGSADGGAGAFRAEKTLKNQLL